MLSGWSSGSVVWLESRNMVFSIFIFRVCFFIIMTASSPSIDIERAVDELSERLFQKPKGTVFSPWFVEECLFSFGDAVVFLLSTGVQSIFKTLPFISMSIIMVWYSLCFSLEIVILHLYPMVRLLFLLLFLEVGDRISSWHSFLVTCVALWVVSPGVATTCIEGHSLLSEVQLLREWRKLSLRHV